MVKPPIVLHKQLNRLLKDRGISLTALSLELGMNKSTLHNYLQGVIPRNIQGLCSIADFFGLSLDELIKGPLGNTDREFKHKVLIVNSNIPSLKESIDLLGRLNYFVIGAMNEEEAVEQLEKVIFDWVLYRNKVTTSDQFLSEIRH